jgi:uncharacterized membrane protein
MMGITIPYFSLDTDIAFLRIKQWVIDSDIWRVAFFTHVFTSCILLFAGFTQFYNPLKLRWRRLHQNMGRIYVIIILFFSGPGGFIMGLYANGGLLSQTAFVTLSLLWIFFTARAYVAIRKGQIVMHGNFMIRSYALTLSAITLRAWKYLLVLFFHPHPMDAYMVVAWLGFVPNLIVAEWLIRSKVADRILGKERSLKTPL